MYYSDMVQRGRRCRGGRCGEAEELSAVRRTKMPRGADGHLLQ
jgi:hypothetical protein